MDGEQNLYGEPVRYGRWLPFDLDLDALNKAAFFGRPWLSTVKDENTN